MIIRKFYNPEEQELQEYIKKSDVKELLSSSMAELIESSGLKILKKAELLRIADKIIERKLK